MAYGKPIPEEVMKPYKASLAALKNKDTKTALKHSKTAWQQAESLMGDDKTTGDLAFSYGFLAMRSAELKSAATAWIRSAELAELAETGGSLIRLERESNLAPILLALNRRSEAERRIDVALDFADEKNLAETVFTAELMVNKARLIAGKANTKAKHAGNLSLASRTNQIGKKSPSSRIQWRSAQYAQKALDIFEKNPNTAIREYRSIPTN